MKTITITLTEDNFRILRNTLYRRIDELYPDAVRGDELAYSEMEEIMFFAFQFENGYCDYDYMRRIIGE